MGYGWHGWGWLLYLPGSPLFPPCGRIIFMYVQGDKSCLKLYFDDFYFGNLPCCPLAMPNMADSQAGIGTLK